MAHAVRMPKPGQMTEECTLTTWLKQEGDPVARGDVLFEIETDKSAMEVEAFDDGVLLRRLVAEGETVPVNAICAYVGAPGEEIPVDQPAPWAAAPGEPGVVATTGSPPPPPAPVARASSGTEASTATRLAISPRARRLAAEAGLDPRTLAGTGPGGRIVERDLRAALGATPGGPPGDDEAPRPLTRMRRVIADRLTASWTSIPHFSVTVAVDVTALLALRAELRAGGTNLGVTDFVLAATARALTEFPELNARTDGVSVWPRRRVHLGLAVAVPGGLVVPVLRDADRLTLGAIHDRAQDLASRAREGTLPLDLMTGSTFTVSNLGMFDVEEFSAIINPGEAAILAVASALPTAVAVGDGLAVRTIMKLTLSADHRLVDGEQGARFLGAIRRRLEDSAAMLDEAAVPGTGGGAR